MTLLPQKVLAGTSGANAAQTLTAVSWDNEVVSADANTGVVAGVFNNGASPWVTIPSVGDRIYVRGFANAANNGTHRVTAADADTITVASSLVNEAAPGSVDIDTTGRFRVHVHGWHVHTQDGLGSTVATLTVVQNGVAVSYTQRMGAAAEAQDGPFDIVGDAWAPVTLTASAAGAGKITDAWLIYSLEQD